jgi:hypothetical protein
MLARAIARCLMTTMLLTVVLVATGTCFQETPPDSSLKAKACSRFYLFEFGGYHYYSTVVCSLNLPCSETTNELIHVHKEKLKAVGCLPNNTACGCQAPEPAGQVELVRGTLQPPPGDTVLNWNPTDTQNVPKNPQGNKWVGIERFTQAKYATTTNDFEGVPKGTFFYLVEFQAVVFDYDPVTGVKAETKRDLCGPKQLAIRLSSQPPRGSKIYPAEVVEEKTAIRLRVAQHEKLFTAAE